MGSGLTWLMAKALKRARRKNRDITEKGAALGSIYSVTHTRARTHTHTHTHSSQS